MDPKFFFPIRIRLWIRIRTRHALKKKLDLTIFVLKVQDHLNFVKIAGQLYYCVHIYCYVLVSWSRKKIDLGSDPDSNPDPHIISDPAGSGYTTL